MAIYRKASIYQNLGMNTEVIVIVVIVNKLLLLLLSYKSNSLFNNNNNNNKAIKEYRKCLSLNPNMESCAFHLVTITIK